ncbi:hypothetical protein OHI65_09200 [Brucella sp. MAB-22]|uniref:hypothetical protein n=1 Tax=Brucella sp. MAB-22 TaxID=2986424 RepID=UPI00221FF68D|nr:hypothetical protein [Brucella sp. MAB-22]UYT54529.1 hypothetical protein OHI65_09200 [Brucella sp. MAB-22]
MAVHQKLEFAKVDDLFLDPLNPRLGRSNTGPKVPQARILKLMRDWTLDELAVSFMESGFWVQEALLVVKEELYGSERLVVVEGNRRLASLKLLQAAAQGDDVDRKWKQIIESGKIPKDLFDSVPYLVADSRQDIDVFLGFRHVTGIKEWPPAEKAEYIAKLIDENGYSYQEVMRKIGSKTPTIRQNYISYRLLLQMEEVEGISIDKVEERFSVLFLSLRTEGVKTYLNIDVLAEPKAAKRPVPSDKLAHLVNFSRWLFGNEKVPPLVADSRQVDNFGHILESEKAVEYLERTVEPRFDTAFQLAGGDAPEIARLIDSAADDIEAALSRVHLYADDTSVRQAVSRLGQDSFQLLRSFPEIYSDLLTKYSAK